MVLGMVLGGEGLTLILFKQYGTIEVCLLDLSKCTRLINRVNQKRREEKRKRHDEKT